jgi:hypothetical protein
VETKAMQYQPAPSPIHGSREELLSRTRDCLQFAELTVANADRDAPMWRIDLGQVSGFEKMMMEIGLLAYLASRSPDCAQDARRLAETVRRHYDSSTTVACILRHPRLATSLGTLLLVLEHFGLATAQEIAAVRSGLDSPFADSSEQVPFRLLDRRWVREVATGIVDPLDEAVRLSSACRTTHPIYMSREDGYAITHTIMYATNFGSRPAPEDLGGEALWTTIDASVAWCLASGDFDLLAEMLLSQIYLRQRLSAYGEIAWRQCRSTWDQMGFLPSPSLSPDAFAQCADEAARRQYAFHNMYHTILVGGLLCLALLDHEPGPALSPRQQMPGGALPDSVGRALQGAAGHLTQVMGISHQDAEQTIAAIRWSADQTDIDTLVSRWDDGSTPPDALRRMAIDASIVMAAHHYDLSQLACALRMAGEIGSATQTVHAGADFLARQSLVNGAIGAGWLQDPDDRPDRPANLESARVTASLANCLAGLHASFGQQAAVHP